jgi:hypothetical protein
MTGEQEYISDNFIDLRTREFRCQKPKCGSRRRVARVTVTHIKVVVVRDEVTASGTGFEHRPSENGCQAHTSTNSSATSIDSDDNAKHPRIAHLAILTAQHGLPECSDVCNSSPSHAIALLTCNSFGKKKTATGMLSCSYDRQRKNELLINSQR